jgi:hypothetical protein
LYFTLLNTEEFAVNLLMALLLTGPVSTPSDPLANLDFRDGTLKGWEGKGFYVTTTTGRGPSLSFGVCSSDRGSKGKTALLHRSFVVPPGAGVIRFTAYLQRGKELLDDGGLDIMLVAAGRRVIPKMVRLKEEWERTDRVLPAANGQAREYIWRVSNYIGQPLRIALVDDDPRAGCHLFSSGFRIVSSDDFESREFGRFMVRLAKEHKLSPVSRFDTKHFLALSNAEDKFTEMRLHNCELIYEVFFSHFRRRGFQLRPPAGKLMVAIFDSQAGFEAYLGHKMPSSTTGVYHPASNRLLVYDFGTNETFVAQRRQAHAEGHRIGSDLDRMRFIETVNRRAREFRSGVNIGTIMHEVAHQLSFNTGLLNREADMPLWLAEGLACYCEATDNQSWQGLGEPNPERIGPLVAFARGQGGLIPLRDLISSDAWLRERPSLEKVLLGYAQSWALFRMLMEERPEQLRKYLRLIYTRTSSEHRLADFGEAFGSDLGRLELRYGEYIKEVVERHTRGRR